MVAGRGCRLEVAGASWMSRCESKVAGAGFDVAGGKMILRETQVTRIC